MTLAGRRSVPEAALAALAKGEFALARDLLTPLVDADQSDASAWFALAHARGGLGDRSGKLAALDRALALAPQDLAILLAKGDYLAEEGDLRAATAFYSAALRYLPRLQHLPAHLQEGLRRAQAANDALSRELEQTVRAQLEREGLGHVGAPRRLAQAVDIMFGRKQAYHQSPKFLYFPELPQIQFYERGGFAWMEAVEAATDAIVEELLGVIGGDFRPYLTRARDRPVREGIGLLDNPDWSAFFMVKDGAEQPGAGRCPKTMAALEHAPLTRIPGRAPSVLYSKLAAGAHIPPHSGMLNARLICHLPLIVPEGCSFRVGNEVRAWEKGKLWAFDDSIEHEAWNRSDEDRYILLFDIWRPELSEEERAGVACVCQAVDAYGGAAAWDA